MKLVHKDLKPNEKRDNNPSRAWSVLFEVYGITQKIEDHGYFDINTNQMMRNETVRRAYRERYPEHSNNIPDNRNILKFDFSSDLPNIFKEYGLEILPVGKNNYRIATFDMYHKIENKAVPISKVNSSIEIASLDFNNITTEPAAQAVAEITGMLKAIF
ncbi:hypothetical protein [Lentilactobacillus sp. Marseille-Q4993]|uniref:type II restriction enzyme n=1 Tax=Lentilactobacillus sp. Marseille-Q4993 TaxID=3039492 RepID=UPI0024BBF935|nr:hypothetical protein [Lentilactobacillus sp. Marseille-Q4993]